MSIAYLQHEEECQFYSDDSPENAADILKLTNRAIRRIAADHFFQTLMADITLTGNILPGDLERIHSVQWSDTDYIAFPISESDRYASPQLYNWFRNLTTTTPLSIGDENDGIITANTTTFTSADPSVEFDATTSTLVGEYIRIGTNGGIYKIKTVTDANTLELTENYRGASVATAYFECRPNGTQKIAFTDYQGDSLSASGVNVRYQKIPLPIYNDYDQIPLPGGCEAVTIMVQQMLMLGDKYDNDALKRQPDYERAIATMQPLSPVVGGNRLPRDRFGVVVASGRRRSMVRWDASNRRILG